MSDDDLRREVRQLRGDLEAITRAFVGVNGSIERDDQGRIVTLRVAHAEPEPYQPDEDELEAIHRVLEVYRAGGYPLNRP